MLQHNKDMQSYLKRHGIECVPKRLDKGSMRGTWRLYQKGAELHAQDIEKLTELGFLDYDGKPLNWLSGNGGGWCVFVIVLDQNRHFKN